MEASWNGGHNITDLSGNRLDDLGANTLWEYTLIDTVAPTVTAINPVSGATLSHLTQIAVTFSEPVAGVDASDLLVNGQAASQVSGAGAGPYTFVFAAPVPGTVPVSWAGSHGIHDLAASPNVFGGGSWSYTLHPGEFSGNVVINEFLAANVSTNGLRDEDGDLEDWIELYNRGGTAVNLGGWSLTDDAEQPGLWVLPAVTLGPGQYLLVFASGKDRSPTNGGNLHANFKLSAAGQYLGLFNANFPREVATQFLPAYPEQRPDLAYGLYNDTFGYLTNPSPRCGQQRAGVLQRAGGRSAGQRAERPVQPSVFADAEHAHAGRVDPLHPGWERTDADQRVCCTAGRSVWRAVRAKPVVNVRAVAFRGDLLCSHVITHSYIFPGLRFDAADQPGRFSGLLDHADQWRGRRRRWCRGTIKWIRGSSPTRLTAALAAQALTNLPTLSMVANHRRPVQPEPGHLRQSESGPGGSSVVGAGRLGGTDPAGRQPGLSCERRVADSRRHQPRPQLDPQTLAALVVQECL